MSPSAILLDLVDAGLVACLLLASGIVLGVLGEVAEATGLLEALDDLVATLALALGKLCLELLAAVPGKNDFLRIHAVPLLLRCWI